MRSLLFCLLLTGALAAKEIPASQVVKVDHREGFTVKTTAHTISVAVVTLKGADKPQFLLVVEGNGVRYFTRTESRPGVDVGEGPDVKYILDQNRKTLTVIRGKKQVIEKFTDLIDS